MSQHDYDLANAAGAAFRSDLNSALAAILSANSGATAPTTTVAGMFWYDTANAVVKQRNAANSGWITRWTVANAEGSFPGALSAVGDFAINTNKFNVTASSGAVQAAGAITSLQAVVAALDGSDSPGSGAYVGVANTANTRYWITQLSGSNYFDIWHFNGTTWTRYARLSTSELAVTGAVTPSKGVESSATTGSIADNGTFNIPSNNNPGLLIIRDSNVTGASAIFALSVTGSLSTILAQSGTLFSATAGTGSKINVYITGGVMQVQNKTGAPVTCTYNIIGTP